MRPPHLAPSIVPGYADRPPQLFEFGHPDHDTYVRTYEPFIAAQFSDEEATDALFTDHQRLRVFKVVHGNRPRKRSVR